MQYLYLLLEVILYGLAVCLYIPVFRNYRYRSVFERRIEERRKTPLWLDFVFLGIIIISALTVFFTWRMLYPAQPRHMSYFLAFFSGIVLGLVFFRRWISHVDLVLCLPSIAIVWVLLLVFEAIILATNAGWVYTDSTVLSIDIGPHVSMILENVIFFYVFSPFMSILFFTGLAYRRSDKVAFFLTMGITWVTGLIWEYFSMAVFNLWVMSEERSVLPINLFGAHTTIEEMLYYVPFASISVLIYLMLYFRKYRFFEEKGLFKRRNHAAKLD